jgi:hypothetical protein
MRAALVDVLSDVASALAGLFAGSKKYFDIHSYSHSQPMRALFARGLE